MGLRGVAWQARRQEILKKYEPLHGLYGQWLNEARKATDALGLSNYVERNKLPVYQKAEGLKQGLTLLEYATSYQKAVSSLQSQLEANCPPLFHLGVQRILDDLLAERVSPLELKNLLEEKNYA